jgi:hypothetical protein
MSEAARELAWRLGVPLEEDVELVVVDERLARRAIVDARLLGAALEAEQDQAKAAKRDDGEERSA